MVDFELHGWVECLGPARFRAKVVAILFDAEQRSAPEERCIECPSLEQALAARARLAAALAHDIRARGNRVIEGPTAVPRHRGPPSRMRDA